MERKSVVQPVIIKGIGLHRGNLIKLTIRPHNKGIIFVRKGLKIPVKPDNIVDTRLNTTLGLRGVSISTIEHLMSALFGLGITDCEVEVSGDEIPAMDGSALPFVEHIEQAGIISLESELSSIVIESSLNVRRGDSWIEASPGNFRVSYEIDFPEVAIGRQCLEYTGNGYVHEIAPARTFGRLTDVEKMRAQGLALGGGLHNAVVVDAEKVLNPEGLRFADEFVRHKVLDILGDLWTLGAPLEAEIRAYKANHELHIELAKMIQSEYLGSNSK
ncbi:MAG: UDP-3-O-[3-hydroxymyristoyl] N-acetylglucosamine deacetylase [Deltaproteobacteria bacterium]|nr:UDP-3-O-[3-hydroxymyristoyl] N-acetylglucosamine deacetylase [Deltaproteobacteria bacterium]